MVVSGSPKRWDRWHIIPQLAVYTTYILPSGGVYGTYHLIGEPETTIDSEYKLPHIRPRTASTPTPWKSSVSTDCKQTFHIFSSFTANGSLSYSIHVLATQNIYIYLRLVY